MKEKKKVLILATGGTIAGKGNKYLQTGYVSGALNVKEVLEEVPQINELAEVEFIQVCNVNSDDITSKIWYELVDIIEENAKDDNIAGFVILHGTDTLEETAYFLNLVIKTAKPVVLTGSMRPTSAISADGPMNIYQAVAVAIAPESVGKGVLAVFSDHIYSARSVAKVSTYSLMAIGSNEMGSMGIIRNNQVFYYELPAQRHTLNSEFRKPDGELPKVEILYFSIDSSKELVQFAAKNSDALVIAGAGAGEFSLEFKEAITNLKIPVIISSRINDGLITQDSVLCPYTIAANNLSPQKAKVLLRLALTQTKDRNELIRIFSQY